MHEFLGITREPMYSPNKVGDDRAILEAVAKRLGVHHRVRVVSIDAPQPQVPPGMMVFAMCQGPSALRLLRQWERAGARIVNSPEAIANCYRRRMLAVFERHQIPHPPSVVISTGLPLLLPVWVAGGVWLKRGDVHAMQPEDVIQVWDRPTAEAVVKRFRRRGIETVLVQRHIQGDVIKFYAVHGRFFSWFPTSETPIRLDPHEQAALTALAEEAAEVLGVEVFGGDVIRDSEGRWWIIDLNDWPSYARCCAAAADAISAYLIAQCEPS